MVAMSIPTATPERSRTDIKPDRLTMRLTIVLRSQGSENGRPRGALSNAMRPISISRGMSFWSASLAKRSGFTGESKKDFPLTDRRHVVKEVVVGVALLRPLRGHLGVIGASDLLRVREALE